MHDNNEGVDLAGQAEELAALMASPPEDADLSELTGLLGVTLLHLYDQEGNLDTLSAAISRLHDALRRDPGHTDRVLWYKALSAGYGERARRTGHLDDHDAAVEWTVAALAELPPDDPDVDDLNVSLAEYGFDRFSARRSRQQWDEATARAEAEQLVSILEPLAAGDPEAASYLRMLLGMGYVERFDVSGAPGDLDRAIPRLEAALSELPPDTPRRPAVGAELVDAHRHRFEATGDRESLDRAIAVAADLIGACDPDQPEWPMLHQSRAEAYERRWHSSAEDPADLDRAIGSWQEVWDVLAEAYAPLSRGVLLYERAHLVTPPVASDLAAAKHDIELALEHGDFPADVLLSVHWNRILIMLALTRLPTGVPDVQERNRLVDEAHAALAAARTAPLESRALLAGVLALGEFSAAGAEFDRFDRGEGDLTLDGMEERVRDLLALAARLPDPPPEWQSLLEYGFGILEIMAAHGTQLARLEELYSRANPGDENAARALARLRSHDMGDRRGFPHALATLRPPPVTTTPPDPDVGRPPVDPYPSRLLAASMPVRAPLDAEVNLTVRIVSAQSSTMRDGWRTQPIKPFDVPPAGVRLTVVVEAPTGLAPLDGLHRSLLVPPAADSEPVLFPFRACSTGLHNLMVTAWLGGTFLGELPMQVSVSVDTAMVDGGPRYSSLDTLRNTPGEITMQILLTGDQYSFQLRTDGYLSDVIPGERLTADPSSAIERTRAMLSSIARGSTHYRSDNAVRLMKELGFGLWVTLVPRELREAFWELQDQADIRVFTVASQHDIVPWELLYPLDHGREAGFLVEQFPILRQVFGQSHARLISVDDPRFVVPPKPPANALSEVDAIRAVVAAPPTDGDVITDLGSLLRVIDSGQAGLLHFACHNTFDPTDSGSITMTDREQFIPALLNTASERRSLKHKAPLVFLNACTSAGESPEYTRMMGWASQFMRAGAGAFVGTLWDVRSSGAHEFAETFYTSLRSGRPLAESAIEARLRLRERDRSDSSWLAYSIYGRPNATAR